MVDYSSMNLEEKVIYDGSKAFEVWKIECFNSKRSSTLNIPVTNVIGPVYPQPSYEIP